VNSTIRSRLERPFWLLIGGLLVACAVNVVQFRPIDDRAWGGYRVIHRYRSSDLVVIGRRGNGIVKQLYGFAFALRDAAPGATIYIPEGDEQPPVELRAQLLTFGGAEKLVPLRYNASEFAPKLSLSAHRIAKQPPGPLPKRLKHTFAILARTSNAPQDGEAIRTPAREFIFLQRKKLDLLVDISLVKGEFQRLKRGH
jgi:hypothetical protein